MGAIWKRAKELVGGLALGVIMAWVLVGGYFIGTTNGMEHLRKSCRLSRLMADHFMEAYGMVSLVVAVLMIGAFVLDSWKHRGTPEIGEGIYSVFAVMIWFVVGNCVLFISMVVWLACSVGHLFR